MIAPESLRMLIARRILAGLVLGLLALIAIGLFVAALPSCVVGEITGGPFEETNDVRPDGGDDQ